MQLFLSPDILAVVRDVLTRPKVLRKFPAWTAEAVESFLAELERHATRVDKVPRAFPLPRHPKDEPYLDLAIFCGAAYLVSRDNDLLDLMKDDDFRQQSPALKVIDPVEFLREIGPEAGPTHGAAEGPTA